jgi:hypothetical protein
VHYECAACLSLLGYFDEFVYVAGR